MLTDAAKIVSELYDFFEKGTPPEFGGMILFIPPDGEHRKLVLSSNKPDSKFFWAQAINYLNVILTEQEEAERSRTGGFR